ncbi:MAG: hypothetical protein M1355_02370 [Patescibacteria group bacterium]|nr:hypothetical protein [Patescibacteria group bacterium]
MKNILPELSTSEFRELKPAPIWGGNILIDRKDIEPLKEAIKEVVQVTKINCFGYFLFGKEETYYHISRYPRRKYSQLPDDQELEYLLKEISKRVDKRREVEPLSPGERFRILTCPREGYSGDKVHSIQEAREKLGEGIILTPAEIFTVRYEGEGSLIFNEEAFVVEGELKDLSKAYSLAEQFKQERFSVENFRTLNTRVVETKYCTAPDIGY